MEVFSARRSATADRTVSGEADAEKVEGRLAGCNMFPKVSIADPLLGDDPGLVAR